LSVFSLEKKNIFEEVKALSLIFTKGQ
jgi:hypothetical protein